MTAVASPVEATSQVLRRSGGTPASSPTVRQRLLVVGGLAVVAGAITVAFWPGHMDLDTVDEYQQAQTGVFTDWHTPTLSALWRVAYLAGLHSPGWVLAASVFTLLLGIYLVLRVQLARWWAAAAAVAVLLFPPVLGWAVQVGRDQWFTTFTVLSFGLAALALRTSGRTRWAALAGVVVACFLGDAARQNALPASMAGLAAAALVVIGPTIGAWRRRLAAAGVGILGALVVFGAQYVFEHDVIHAESTHVEQGLYVYDLAALSRIENKVLFPADVYPKQDLAYLRTWTNPLDTNAILWGPQAVMHVPMSDTQFQHLQQAWRDALRTYPTAYLHARLSLTVRMLALDMRGWFVYEVPPQPPGWLFHTRFPAVHDAAMNWVGIGTTVDGYTVYGGPLQTVWVYVVLLLGAVVWFGWRRTSSATLLALFAAAALLFSAVLFVVAPIVAWRYMYPAVVVSVIVTVLMALDVARVLRARRRTVPG